MRIRGYLANLGKYNEGALVGEWIEFPVSEEELNDVYKRIGINFDEPINGVWYEEMFIADWDCDFSHEFGEYESIEYINQIAESLEDWDETLFHACAEVWLIKELFLDNSSNYYLMPNVCTDEEIGEYVVNELNFFDELPPAFHRYFDYDLYGRDFRLSVNGGFTTKGFVYKYY